MIESRLKALKDAVIDGDEELAAQAAAQARADWDAQFSQRKEPEKEMMEVVLLDFGGSGRILCESPVMEQDALLMKKSWLKISREKE